MPYRALFYCEFGQENKDAPPCARSSFCPWEVDRWISFSKLYHLPVVRATQEIETGVPWDDYLNNIPTEMEQPVVVFHNYR